MMPSAIIRLLAILRTGARYVERVAGHESALKVLARLRPQLFRAIAQGPPEAALSLSSGEMSARLVQDVDAVQTLFVRRSVPVSLGAGGAAAIVLASLATPWAGLALSLSMAVACIGGVLIARRLAEPAGRAAQVAVGVLKDRLAALEAVTPELKAYGLEGWAAEQAATAAADHDQAQIALTQSAGWMAAWQAVAVALAVALVVPASAGAALPLTAPGRAGRHHGDRGRRRSGRRPASERRRRPSPVAAGYAPAGRGSGSDPRAAGPRHRPDRRGRSAVAAPAAGPGGPVRRRQDHPGRAADRPSSRAERRVMHRRRRHRRHRAPRSPRPVRLRRPGRAAAGRVGAREPGSGRIGRRGGDVARPGRCRAGSAHPRRTPGPGRPRRIERRTTVGRGTSPAEPGPRLSARRPLAGAGRTDGGAGRRDRSRCPDRASRRGWPKAARA